MLYKVTFKNNVPVYADKVLDPKGGEGNGVSLWEPKKLEGGFKDYIAYWTEAKNEDEAMKKGQEMVAKQYEI